MRRTGAVELSSIVRSCADRDRSQFRKRSSFLKARMFGQSVFSNSTIGSHLTMFVVCARRGRAVHVMVGVRLLGSCSTNKYSGLDSPLIVESTHECNAGSSGRRQHEHRSWVTTRAKYQLNPRSRGVPISIVASSNYRSKRFRRKVLFSPHCAGSNLFPVPIFHKQSFGPFLTNKHAVLGGAAAENSARV